MEIVPRMDDDAKFLSEKPILMVCLVCLFVASLQSTATNVVGNKNESSKYAFPVLFRVNSDKLHPGTAWYVSIHVAKS